MAVKILTISIGKCSNISLSSASQEEEKTVLSAITKSSVSSNDNQVEIKCGFEGLRGDAPISASTQRHRWRAGATS